MDGRTCRDGVFFLSLTIGLVLLARFHYIIHSFASNVGARIAPSLDSGQKLDSEAISG